jgi:hypothetical protein
MVQKKAKEERAKERESEVYVCHAKECGTDEQEREKEDARESEISSFFFFHILSSVSHIDVAAAIPLY